jgi:dethiobiotin synthetase
LRKAGRYPAAIKPAETGVVADPFDALALARACNRPGLTRAPGLYRAALPLSPYSASLEDGIACPEPAALASVIRTLAADADCLLVEGAGGLLVPLTATTSMADLARELALPLLIVAPDQLGVLSSLLTCVESALARRLHVAAVILSARAPDPEDPSPRTNRRILQERLRAPVLSFPFCADDDVALADAARSSGLLALMR